MPKMSSKLSLEELVTAVAYRLMAVDSATLLSATGWALQTLVEYFDVDLSFLRHNDHVLRTTTLVAEWPVRESIPDPDPLGVVHFDNCDPVFAAHEHLAEVLLTRPQADPDDYTRRVHEGSGIMGVSSANVPLRSQDVTTGVLGFIKFGDREWTQAEINALKAIAALLAQLQARVFAEDQLKYLAYHDELTGVSNRRALVDDLQEKLGSDRTGPIAILFFDLDRLKAMNDFLGHGAGDEFLKSVATRLRTNLKADDVVARLGGDEFVVVLDAPTDVEAATAVAARLQKAVSEPVRLGTEEVSRAVSVGVAIAEPGQLSVSELLGQADQAVLAAKSSGGNAIFVFTAEMQAHNRIRTDIELHLRGAIHDGDLTLHYQPEVDLRTGKLLGAEALVRWKHPTLGLLPPDAFIGVAEATNLAGELGRWILGRACRDLAGWRAGLPGVDFCLRVNVSPAQLITLDFVKTVANALRENDLDGSHLSLEITEHAVLSDLDHARRTLQQLKAIGVTVAIDDFGTGYSSLAQLKTLPVEGLKIDQTFVRELGANPDDLAIVRSIAGLAASFGLDLIAEGVETEVAARTLLKLGCFRAQGFLIGRPVPAADMYQLMARGYLDLNGADSPPGIPYPPQAETLFDPTEDSHPAAQAKRAHRLAQRTAPIVR